MVGVRDDRKLPPKEGLTKSRCWRGGTTRSVSRKSCSPVKQEVTQQHDYLCVVEGYDCCKQRGLAPKRKGLSGYLLGVATANKRQGLNQHNAVDRSIGFGDGSLQFKFLLNYLAH